MTFLVTLLSNFCSTMGLVSNFSSDIAALMLVWQAGFPPKLFEAIKRKLKEKFSRKNDPSGETSTSGGELTLGGGSGSWSSSSSLNHVGEDDDDDNKTKKTQHGQLSGGAGGRNKNSADGALVVSRDTQILLFIASVWRVYWSCSPPAVWISENPVIATACITEVAVSPFVWGLVVLRMVLGEWLLRERSDSGVGWEFTPPLFLRWPILLLGAVGLGSIGSYLAHPFHKGKQMWPFAFGLTVSTMTMEGLAMIPQMALSAAIDRTRLENSFSGVGSSSDGPPITSRFIGMISLGRSCRLLFWIACAVHQELITGSVTEALRSLSLFWPLILPDMCNTFLMMDYLMLLCGRGPLENNNKGGRNNKTSNDRTVGEKALLQSMGFIIPISKI